MRRPIRYRKYEQLVRSVGVISAMVVVLGGVTYAALQSQQVTLTGNSIESATANLQLSTDGTNYSDTRAGFDFNNLVPGGPAVPVAGNAFYLKNAGGTPLSLKLAVSSTPSNLGSIDLSKVTVLLTTVGGGGTQSFSLASLIAGFTSGGVAVTGSLANGTAQQYKLQVSMTSDAFSGNGASLGNIDFAFSGTALSQ